MKMTDSIGRYAVWIAAGAVALAGLAFLAALLAYRLSPGLQDRVFARGAAGQLMRGAQVSPDTEALQVLLCGTSSPLPIRNAAKACMMVIAGDRMFLVDIGPEATENLSLWRVNAQDIEGVFITHFHSDHIGGLGEFNLAGFAQGRTQPLDVYGPEGVDRVVSGFDQAYAFDRIYRNTLHGHGGEFLPLEASQMWAHPIPLAHAGDTPTGRTMEVYNAGGLVVTAIETDHRPVTPAFSYRFDYRGRSVVITGDTVYFQPLAEAASGADVLISEAQAHHMQNVVADAAQAQGQETLASVLRDTSQYHLNPVEAARMANEAGVRELVYTHIAPPLALPLLHRNWLRGVHDERPDGVTIGHDGLLITIPVADRPIRFETLED